MRQPLVTAQANDSSFSHDAYISALFIESRKNELTFTRERHTPATFTSTHYNAPALFFACANADSPAIIIIDRHKGIPTFPINTDFAALRIVAQFHFHITRRIYYFQLGANDFSELGRRRSSAHSRCSRFILT